MRFVGSSDVHQASRHTTAEGKRSSLMTPALGRMQCWAGPEALDGLLFICTGCGCWAIPAFDCQLDAVQ